MYRQGFLDPMRTSSPQTNYWPVPNAGSIMSGPMDDVMALPQKYMDLTKAGDWKAYLLYGGLGAIVLAMYVPKSKKMKLGKKSISSRQSLQAVGALASLYSVFLVWNS